MGGRSTSAIEEKIVSTETFSKLREKLRAEGKKVVQCHGVFDLLHPGHIGHLEEAKAQGDTLVVSVTSAPYVNKGPGRPYFTDEQRMKSLAALSCVDYVLLSKAVTVIDIMECIKPDLYVKGSEYENADNDVTGNIDKEVERVRLFGGDVFYTNGEVFSSTKLLNNAFPVMPPNVAEFAREFSQRSSFKKVKETVDLMKDIKVLVIGDIIIDDYIFCVVQGLMSKDRAFSAKYFNEERYLGGSLAIARHLANFSKNVTVCGVVGDEPHIHSRILNDLGKDMLLDLQFDPNFHTIIKRRFIERHGIRNEYEKLFSINYLNDYEENIRADKTAFYEKLENIVPNFDMVVVTDFGHGLIDETVMEIVQSKAAFLAVNCQTNSSNYGTNLITKYKRADTFTLDERELRLAYSNRSENPEKLLTRLVKHMNAKAGWVTLGSLGAIGADDKHKAAKIPALTLTVQDTVGAGDAYFSLASLCAYFDVPFEVGSFLGSIAGALAANVLGNSKAVSKVDVLKFASTLLKF
ncbi:PfkB family carbohydrate kinase [Acetivibrio cellulolyticus]|uniref:PfkB family carbohydrate kinase n=1 Tax=Acetivibrio cellulolyticus TaxID=35830 RepID=UPI0001E2FB47|nr:PfkB family carbohydrate kinase [Acetivibrio cellulolyticus]